jgi:chromosome partitioning protein
VRKHLNRTLAIAGIVPTIFNNASQDKAILEALKEQLASIATIYAPIPRATAFADAAMSRQPLAVYAPKHPSLIILDEIAKGIEAL